MVQVLPSEVITSLPNANIADALGRLPSVTLERDEGEGKYVQIRGTEPRLSNMTIDGINVPSPETGVRRNQARRDPRRHRRGDRHQQDPAGEHGRRRHRRFGQPGDEDRRGSTR